MRYRLRTLLILLTVLPPIIAGAWFWRRESQKLRPPPSLAPVFKILEEIEKQQAGPGEAPAFEVDWEMVESRAREAKRRP